MMVMTCISFILFSSSPRAVNSDARWSMDMAMKGRKVAASKSQSSMHALRELAAAQRMMSDWGCSLSRPMT